MTLYRRDFHAWADEQTNLLGSGISTAWIRRPSRGNRRPLDLAAYASTPPIAQLTRWQLPPSLQSHEWRCLIGSLRNEIERQVEDMPSLEAKQSDVYEDAYEDAWWIALLHTVLPEAALPNDQSVQP